MIDIYLNHCFFVEEYVRIRDFRSSRLRNEYVQYSQTNVSNNTNITIIAQCENVHYSVWFSVSFISVMKSHKYLVCRKIKFICHALSISYRYNLYSIKYIGTTHSDV